jgi:hypothetical protein
MRYWVGVTDWDWGAILRLPSQLWKQSGSQAPRWSTSAREATFGDG